MNKKWPCSVEAAKTRGEKETRPGTEKRCSHNLQSDPIGSGFNKSGKIFRSN